MERKDYFNLLPVGSLLAVALMGMALVKFRMGQSIMNAEQVRTFCMFAGAIGIALAISYVILRIYDDKELVALSPREYELLGMAAEYDYGRQSSAYVFVTDEEEDEMWADIAYIKKMIRLDEGEIVFMCKGHSNVINYVRMRPSNATIHYVRPHRRPYVRLVPIVPR